MPRVTRWHADRALALQKDPSYIEAHLRSAALYEAEGRLEEYEREITETAAANPNDEAAACLLFDILSTSRKSAKESAERTARADAVLAKWLPIARSPAVLNAYAWTMAIGGRAAEAVLVARRSTKLNPSCAGCFDTLAVALFRCGDFKAAVTAQEMAVAVLRHGTRNDRLVQRLELYRAAWAAIVLWKKRPEPGKDPQALPSNVANAIWLAQRPHLDDCYEQARERNPRLSGSLVLHGEIGPDGKVSGAQVVPPDQWDSLPDKPSLPPMPDQDMSRCVADHLGATRFPESSLSTRLVLPVTFAPRKSQ